MKTVGKLLLLILLCATQALGADQLDPLVSKVEQFKAEGAAVFVSDCQLGNVKFILMFRAGELQGGFTQIARTDHGPVTMNLGGINIENGHWTVVGSTGGEMSGQAQSGAMNYLMKLPFQLLLKDQLESIYRKPSGRRCKFG